MNTILAEFDAEDGVAIELDRPLLLQMYFPG